MSLEQVVSYLDARGYADRVRTFEVSSATVELAAQAVGVPPAQIAKTLSFRAGERVNSSKFKKTFGAKGCMLGHDEVEGLVGHPVGGVCPFAVREGVEVWLDESLRRFAEVYPAAGTPASAVRLTPDELQDACGDAFAGWCDVCKLPGTQAVGE